MVADGGLQFVCVDPRGIRVSCPKEQWQHLIKHEEMEGKQGVVKAIIESPDFINQSASNKNREVYYKLLVLPKTGSTYIRVVVSRKGKALLKKKAYVVNAFACDGEQQGEVRIWTKPLE